MRVLAVIAARGSSSRLPRKNLAEVGGKTLVQHATQAALQSRLVDTVAVSTDDAEIALSARAVSSKVLSVHRPSALSTDYSPVEEAVRYTMLKVEEGLGLKGDDKFTHVLTLRASQPFRQAGAIDQLIDFVEEEGLGGGLSVIKRSPWQWTLRGEQVTSWWDPNRYPRSQDVPQTCYEELSAIQLGLRREVLDGNRWSSPLGLIELPPWTNIDIDTQEDLDFARSQWPAVHGLLLTEQKLPTVKVRVPMVEVGVKRYYGKVYTDCLRNGTVGIVLGNGPQIDKMPDEAFRVLESPEFCACGVNRIASSVRIREAGYYPNLHLIWDAPHKPPSREQVIRQGGLLQMEGRTWRIAQCTDGMSYYPTDQYVNQTGNDTADLIEAGVHCRRSSTDGAVNLLYKMGCREVYMFGVEMNDTSHCQVLGGIPNEKGIWGNQNSVQGALDALTKLLAASPGLKLYSACKNSKLVHTDTLPYKVPDALAAFDLG